MYTKFRDQSYHSHKGVWDLKRQLLMQRGCVILLERASFSTHWERQATWEGETEETQAPLLLKKKAGQDKRKRVV